MFVIKIDGRNAAVTNDYDSAVFYAEGLRGRHRITIRLLLPGEVESTVQSLLGAQEVIGSDLSKAS